MPDTFAKDPDALLDYKTDWADWLADDETISASTWVVDPDDDELTVGTDAQAPSHDDTSATVWLSGGTVNTIYRVTNHVTTSAGRIDDRTLTISVIDR